MRSTGEVMGVDQDLGRAFAKAYLGAGQVLPTEGKVLLALRENDRTGGIALARRIDELGFSLLAMVDTHELLSGAGLTVEPQITSRIPSLAARWC